MKSLFKSIRGTYLARTIRVERANRVLQARKGFFIYGIGISQSINLIISYLTVQQVH